MSFYFRQNGKPRIWLLTGTTLALALPMWNAYNWSQVKVQDSHMATFMWVGNRVLYRHYNQNTPVADLRNKIVAIKNPENGDIMLRRVIALPNQWVRRSDDGGLI